MAKKPAPSPAPCTFGAIELQFSRAPDWSSDLIAYFGGGRWSHVDARLQDGSGRLLGARDEPITIDGVTYPAGVEIRPPGYLRWADVEVWRLKVTAEQQAAFYDFLTAQLHKPYDERAILGFAAGRDWRDPSAWFCAEVDAAGLEQALSVSFALPTNKITPNDLYIGFSMLRAVKVEP
jgi:hypothetical protein